MKKIIYVPGKNPKPPAEQHRQQLFRCLLQGVQRIDPDIADDIAASDSFTLVAWNRHFYDAVIGIEQITPWVDRLLEQQTFPESDIAAVRSVKYRLARLLYQIGDHLHWLIPFIPDQRIKASIQDTARYFHNHNDIACKIRDLQKQPLREAAENNDKVLLIGHSMGSIIAYDSMWELHHLENLVDCVDTLLTIGSPLGMHYVQKHLSGLKNKQAPSYPGNLRQWINISARGDLVALDRSLADDFRAMIDSQQIESITDWRENIFNHYRDSKGLNVHKSYGYLINPVVSKTITDWWRAT
ncbi:MAG: hypothetical protein ABFS24_13965 [Pseudomonadota bacterium]